MNKLINYNRVVFKVGGWFTKFWMITMPIFILFLIFGDLTPFNGEVSTLWIERAQSWPMLVFYSMFLIGYPFRNYLEVDRIIKGAGYESRV
jgi:hypothetical protein